MRQTFVCLQRAQTIERITFSNLSANSGVPRCVREKLVREPVPGSSMAKDLRLAQDMDLGTSQVGQGISGEWLKSASAAILAA
jgi:hypothetical protein